MEIFRALERLLSLASLSGNCLVTGRGLKRLKYVLVWETCKWWTNWSGTSMKMRIYWKVVTFLVLLRGSYRVWFRGIKYPKVEFKMGTSQSTWRVTNKVPKRRQSNTAKNGSLARGHKFKSESNLLDEVRTKNVQTNPLYRHQEIFDNDLFFEEILAKIEQEAAKLSNSDKHSESPKGFDSFMLYWLKLSLRDNPRYQGKIW